MVLSTTHPLERPPTVSALAQLKPPFMLVWKSRKYPSSPPPKKLESIGGVSITSPVTLINARSIRFSMNAPSSIDGHRLPLLNLVCQRDGPIGSMCPFIVS